MSKQLRIALFLAVLLISILVGVRGLVRQQHARQVIRECMAATDVLQKSPPGFARGEEFIRRIRAIDTRGAPNDLVAALHEHIDLLEQSFQALREGKNHEQLDKQVAAAKERFAAKVKKYWQADLDDGLRMHDTIGYLIASLFTGIGASALLFPQWYYQFVTSMQAARDRKRVRVLGLIMLPAGLLLLTAQFLRW